MLFIRRHFMHFALAVPVCLAALPSQAEEGSAQAQLVPIALLVDGSDSAEYPQPTCETCKLLRVEKRTTAAGEAQGLLSLTYHDEHERDFVGTIELTMVLTDGTVHAEDIEDVVLTEDQEGQWAINEDPNQWTWDQVDMVRVELTAD